jgi:hypothetical protein
MNKAPLNKLLNISNGEISNAVGLTNQRSKLLPANFSNKQGIVLSQDAG